MVVEASVTVNGNREAVWTAVVDIANTSELYVGVESIEMVEHPVAGLLGMRWREDRILFGRAAAAVKWETQSVPRMSYNTSSEDPGYRFRTTLQLVEQGSTVVVKGSHTVTALSLWARIMIRPMRWFYKNAVRRAILKDLNDIKNAVDHPKERPAPLILEVP